MNGSAVSSQRRDIYLDSLSDMQRDAAESDVGDQNALKDKHSENESNGKHHLEKTYIGINHILHARIPSTSNTYVY